MIEYKDVDFYTRFFSDLEDFQLDEPFKEVGGEFQGYIDAIGTVHPLKIRVVIPKIFPHQRMMFLTDSLVGYPHLIYSTEKKTSWFCLNAPFAETAEKQLTVELDRLRSWIKKMMNKDLPAKIDNPGLIRSLRIANIYGWEIFENDEYSSVSKLIFIGDFANDARQFVNEGMLHCKRVKIGESESKFYVFEENREDFEDIPYIIVDHFASNPHSLKEMASDYGWDDEILNRLLPKLYYEDKYYWPDVLFYSDLQEKIKDIDRHRDETTIKKEHRRIVDELIDFIKSNASDGSKGFFTTLDDFREFEKGEKIDGNDLMEEIKCYYSKKYHFAVGVRQPDNLVKWFLFSASRNDCIKNEIKYKIGKLDVSFYELKDIILDVEKGCVTDYRHYFGRGCINPNLAKKNIAIIGAGAVGSRLIESLVRNGVRQITIWDGDTVEPGNICRSIYTLEDIGMNKAEAIARRMGKISPFCKITAIPQDLHGKIDYMGQQMVADQLQGFDLIFDCTASNELLHFLSYAVENEELVSLCITNHAQDLLCVSSRDGNVYDLRKVLLAKIEQDTENFYVEGTGCYEPTFLASGSNIGTLVDLYLTQLDSAVMEGKDYGSVVISRRHDGLYADALHTYFISKGDVKLNILESTMNDLDSLPDTYNYAIGYLLGAYSDDRRQVIVTHAVSPDKAEESLEMIFRQSEGIIDYIGEFHYLNENVGLCNPEVCDELAGKATDPEINTNNPLLVLRPVDGAPLFYLFSDGELLKFNESK